MPVAFEVTRPALHLRLFIFTDSPRLNGIFEVMKQHWNVLPKVDKKKLTSFKGKKMLDPLKNDVLTYLKSCPEIAFVRDDYKELKDLTVFLVDPDFKISEFKKPGSLSNARFMAKALYTLKAYIFQAHLDLEKEEKEGIKDLAAFITHIYSKYWLQSTSLADAACNDLRFLKEVKLFAKVNRSISDAVIKKFSLHSNYLSGELVGFSLFSSKVSAQQKRDMIAQINDTAPSWNKRSIYAKFEYSDTLTLADMIDPTTLIALESCVENVRDIIKKDPETWDTLSEYKKASELISQIQIINDPAERGVKLAKDFNEFGTRDEKQLQKLMKNVEHTRKLVPKATKKHMENLK